MTGTGGPSAASIRRGLSFIRPLLTRIISWQIPCTIWERMICHSLPCYRFACGELIGRLPNASGSSSSTASLIKTGGNRRTTRPPWSGTSSPSSGPTLLSTARSHRIPPGEGDLSTRRVHQTPILSGCQAASARARRRAAPISLHFENERIRAVQPACSQPSPSCRRHSAQDTRWSTDIAAKDAREFLGMGGCGERMA
jgi:hypothetical protein